MQEWNQGVATQRGGLVVVNGPNGPVNTTLSQAVTPGPSQPTAYTPGTADIKQQQGGAYETLLHGPEKPGRAADHHDSGGCRCQRFRQIRHDDAETADAGRKRINRTSVDHNTDQQVYQQPQVGIGWQGVGHVDAPVVFSPAAQAQESRHALHSFCARHRPVVTPARHARWRSCRCRKTVSCRPRIRSTRSVVVRQYPPPAAG